VLIYNFCSIQCLS